MITTTTWVLTIAFVLGLLLFDFIFHVRKAHAPSIKEAALWTAIYVSIALSFGAYVWLTMGSKSGMEYYAGYITEMSLSVDNLFVFLMVFQYFAVPAALQPRVLKWGIFGAMLMRAVMIGAGALLLQQFTWIVYVFGGVLVLTGLKMFRGGDERVEPEKNPLVRLARKVFPVTPAYEGQHFFVRNASGVLMATPLLLVLLVVEWSDLVFAIDSIPAVFAVTRDPFVVYASNLFAILGLRALFFVLAGAMDNFRFLKPGVALILLFVGAKMIASAWIHPSTVVSLVVIVTILAGAIGLSLLRPGQVDQA